MQLDLWFDGGCIIHLEWQKKHSGFVELCSLPSLFKYVTLHAMQN